jgi:hypothetical protein
MSVLGLVCALTLSVIGTGFRLDKEWDPAMGPAPAVFLKNHPSAYAEAAFVTDAVMTGVATGTMRICRREELVCILPLGVAFNSAGKRRLIWDGRHVNRHLRKHRFRMETLQREGRALFERSHFGGTVNISSAYHHLEMAPDATKFLGFEWMGTFYCFEVLPFGLSSAPWLFTTVMSHCSRFLRSVGTDLISYLDDLIFASDSAHGALTSAQRMLAVLGEFGWLIHPTKCVGTTAPAQLFVALGTLVDLVTHTYSVPPTTVDRLLHGITALLTGPPSVGVRSIARVKGLITSTWVATGSATRIRTRAMDAVIESRAKARAGASRRERRETWSSAVQISDDCRVELQWWLDNLDRINGQDIRPLPLAGIFDSVIECDASDTGVGAVILVEAAALGTSTLVAALLASAAGTATRRLVRQRVREGLELMKALPAYLLDASSTLRELFGIWTFVTDLAPRLSGGRHRVQMDNLGCVFIMGGIVPPFAVGGKEWGEFVSGGSPNPDLQRLAVQLFDIQLQYGFTLVFEWVPRDRNVRADFLSHVSALRHHHYRLRPEQFAYLDGLWGPHTIDRFATAETCQPLLPPNEGRFCAQFFHPDAEWIDAFTLPWDGENNWVFPPIHKMGEAVAHLRASAADATLIAPVAPWAPWWHSLRRGRSWAPDISRVVPLGPPSMALDIPAEDAPLFRDVREMIAIRIIGRARPRAGGGATA